MEIILHCGLPKTASTFLQYFFFENKAQLEQNGIFYPSIPGVTHYDCAPGIPPIGSAMPHANMRFYIEQAQAKGLERIFFSNELFLMLIFRTIVF